MYRIKGIKRYRIGYKRYKKYKNFLDIYISLHFQFANNNINNVQSNFR